MVYLKSALVGLLAVVLSFCILGFGFWIVMSFPKVLKPCFRSAEGGLWAGSINLLPWLAGIVAVAFAAGFIWEFRRVSH